MSIGSPRIHMICGFCGCNKEFTFKIMEDGRMNIEGETVPTVYITCHNCGTVTSLDEMMREKDG